MLTSLARLHTFQNKQIFTRRLNCNISYYPSCPRCISVNQQKQKRNYLGFTSSANITRWFSLALYLTKWNDSWMSLTTTRVPIVLRPMIKLGSFCRKRKHTETTTLKELFQRFSECTFSVCLLWTPLSSIIGYVLVHKTWATNWKKRCSLPIGTTTSNAIASWLCGTIFPALFLFGPLHLLSGVVTGQWHTLLYQRLTVRSIQFQIHPW